MNISDLNRLEKQLAKFKSYVTPGYQPTAEETAAMELIKTQVEQIEESLFNLRAAKGSVAGLILRSLTQNRAPEFEQIYFTANEKGFSVMLPVYNLIPSPNGDRYDRAWNERIGQWMTTITRASYQHYAGHELPERDVQIILSLNQIHPKLKMYNIRNHGMLEFNFEISKRTAMEDSEREPIMREIMRTVQFFVQQQRQAMGLAPLGVPA